MKKHLLILLIGLAATNLSTWCEEVSEKALAFSTVLYGSENDIPLNINSDNGWIDISSFDTSEIYSLNAPIEGTIRKWRIKSSYSDNTVAGQSTIQIKLKANNNEKLIFTLPWSEGKKGWKDNSSNWYQTDLNGKLPINYDKSISSVRLIAPPGSSSPGMVYKVTLEAWDIKTSDDEENILSIIQRASANSIPEIRVANREAIDKNIRLQRKIPDKDLALNFALSFINSSMSDDLPSFYNNLDQTVYSLHTGTGGSKFRVKPPENYYTNYSLADYTAKYQHKIYSYNEYSKLFPHWVSHNRQWSPDRNTYLFFGSAVKDGKEGFITDDILVFMCKEINNEWKIVAMPE